MRSAPRLRRAARIPIRRCSTMGSSDQKFEPARNWKRVGEVTLGLVAALGLTLGAFLGGEKWSTTNSTITDRPKILPRAADPSGPPTPCSWPQCSSLRPCFQDGSLIHKALTHG